MGLTLAEAMLTALSFTADRVLSFLARGSRLLVCGTSLGIGGGVWVGRLLPPVRSTTASTNGPLKPTPQAEAVN
ncbi:MAG: hypothetical protein WCH39_28800 [Schlesneria sp.]